MNTPFPKPLRVKGRLFFNRYELEAYKAELLGLPAPERGSGPIELVTAVQAAKEFGFGPAPSGAGSRKDADDLRACRCVSARKE